MVYKIKCTFWCDGSISNFEEIRVCNVHCETVPYRQELGALRAALAQSRIFRSCTLKILLMNKHHQGTANLSFAVPRQSCLQNLDGVYTMYSVLKSTQSDVRYLTRSQQERFQP